MGTASPALPQLHGSHGCDSDSRTTCGFKPAYKENPKSQVTFKHLKHLKLQAITNNTNKDVGICQTCLLHFCATCRTGTYQHSYCITTVCRSISEYQGSCEIQSSKVYHIRGNSQIPYQYGKIWICNHKTQATCHRFQEPSRQSFDPDPAEIVCLLKNRLKNQT